MHADSPLTYYGHTRNLALRWTQHVDCLRGGRHNHSYVKRVIENVEDPEDTVFEVLALFDEWRDSKAFEQYLIDTSPLELLANNEGPVQNRRRIAGLPVPPFPYP